MFESICWWIFECFIWIGFAIVCFYIVSILTFAATGKSLLWRIVIFLKRERERREEEELEKPEETEEEAMRRFKSYDGLTQETIRAHNLETILLKRFNQEFEKKPQQYPDLKKVQQRYPHKLVDPLPYLLAGDVENIRMFSTTPDEPYKGFNLVPWFAVVEDDGTHLIFHANDVYQRNMYQLLIKGWYDKPRYQNISKLFQKYYQE